MWQPVFSYLNFGGKGELDYLAWALSKRKCRGFRRNYYKITSIGRVSTYFNMLVWLMFMGGPLVIEEKS